MVNLDQTPAVLTICDDHGRQLLRLRVGQDRVLHIEPDDTVHAESTADVTTAAQVFLAYLRHQGAQAVPANAGPGSAPHRLHQLFTHTVDAWWHANIGSWRLAQPGYSDIVDLGRQLVGLFPIAKIDYLGTPMDPADIRWHSRLVCFTDLTPTAAPRMPS